MSYASLLIDAVTIYNPDEPGSGEEQTDRYGNPLFVQGAGAVSTARVQQLIADEDLRDRDTRVTRYRIFLPAAAPITSLSTIEWEGRLHRVHGEPAFVDGRSGIHHVEAAIERIDG